MTKPYKDFSNNLKKKHDINIKQQKKEFPERKFPFSYKYFENHYCEFFPCHPDSSKGHNCLFCKCPLYNDESCVGVQNGDGVILENGFKDCSGCTHNHEYGNAEEMMWTNIK